MKTNPQINIEQQKLLILKLFDNFEDWLSDVQVLRAFVELDIMNYFDLMALMDALTSGNFLKTKDFNNQKHYKITDKGRDVLIEFESDILHSFGQKIDEYIIANSKRIKAESQYSGDVFKIDKDDYRANLKMLDGDIIVFEISLKFFTYQDASAAVTNWKSQASDIFSYVLKKLQNIS